MAVDIVDVLVKRKLQRLEERELAAEHSLMQPKPHPLIAAQLLHEHSTVKYCDKLKNDTQDDPQVSNECHSKDIRFTKEVYSCLFSMCQGIVDLPYRHKPYIPDPSSYKVAAPCEICDFVKAEDNMGCTIIVIEVIVVVITATLSIAKNSNQILFNKWMCLFSLKAIPIYWQFVNRLNL